MSDAEAPPTPTPEPKDPPPSTLRNAAILKVFAKHVDPAVKAWRATEAKNRDAFLNMMDSTAQAVRDHMSEREPGNDGKWFLKPEYKAFFEDQGIAVANNARHPFNAPFKYALWGDLPWGLDEAARSDEQKAAITYATTEASRYANVAAWALREGKKPSEVIAEHGGLREAADIYSLAKIADKNTGKEKVEDEADRLARLERDREERRQRKLKADTETKVNGDIVTEKKQVLVVTKKEVEKSESEAVKARKAAEKIDRQLKAQQDRAKELEAEAKKNAEKQKELEAARERLAAENKRKEEEQKAEAERLAAEAKAQQEAEAAARKTAEAEAKKKAKNGEGFKAIPLPKLSVSVDKLMSEVGTDLLLHIRREGDKWMVVDKPILFLTHEAKEPKESRTPDHDPQQPTAH